MSPQNIFTSRIFVIIAFLLFLLHILVLWNFQSYMYMYYNSYTKEISNDTRNQRAEFYEEKSQDKLDGVETVERTYPKYNDDLLVKWEPAPETPKNESEPGHLGKTVVVPSSMKQLAEESFQKYKVNVVVSDMIPFNRTIKDFRPKECLSIKYPEKLPPTTVVIVFCDEAWSTLLRTVWSVYTKSPRALLKEIILVDDNSTLPHLGKQLDDYIKQIPVKIQILRLKQRSGATVAKELGAKLVTTPTITFIDSHCECNDGWLEPLLTNVLENRKMAPTPMLEFFEPMSLGYTTYSEEPMYGSFDWHLIFHWVDVPQREKNRINGSKIANLRTPEFAGGVFTIDKEYFNDMGGYDKNMTFYAAENIEMTLRLWMCGGSIETIPCSRVTHLERSVKPYSIPEGLYQSIAINTVRVVDVWLDEYKKIYYGIHPEALAHRSNVTERIELRKRLQCKPFKWYIENIFPESVYARKYIDIGSIESVAKIGSCIDIRDSERNIIKLHKCEDIASGNQTFMITEKGEIVTDYQCIKGNAVDQPIALELCGHQWMNDPIKNHKFFYDIKTKTFKYDDGKNCLGLRNNEKITILPCDGSKSQKWMINSFVPPDSVL